MKKTTLVLIAIITTTLFTQAQERIAYTKAQHELYPDVNRIQMHVSEEVVYTNNEPDTVITYRNGHPIMIVTSKPKTITIRAHAKGKIASWSDTLVQVNFVVVTKGFKKKKQNITIAFAPLNGNGTGQAIGVKTVPDSTYVWETPKDFASKPQGYKERVAKAIPNTHIAVLNEVRYKVSGHNAHLEFEPIRNDKEEAENSVSKDLIVR